jgi:stage III sporulation protein AE
MKKLFVILFFLITVTESITIFASDNMEILDDYAEMFGEEIEEGTKNLKNTDFDKLIPGFNAQELLSGIAKGENAFSIQKIMNKGIELFAGEIKATLKILAFIFAIGILCTYITSMQNSLKGQGASNAAFFVCYLVITGMAAAAFVDVVDCGKTVISNLAVFMKTMAPVALVTLASSGAIASATTFEIIVMGVIELSQWLLENLFVPMIVMSAALSLVNNMTEKLNAEKLVQFLNKATKWGIGIVMTLFVGVMGLQGLVSGSADGLTVKVTKFATTNLIPLVGGALSETVETVMNCGVIIKNSVGVAGIIVVILIVAVPVMKVAACLMMFRLCAAVLQPISDKRIVKCVSELADSISGIFGMMIVFAVMFIIMLTIIINVGNSAAMLGK